MSSPWTGVGALWQAGLRGAGVGVGHLDSGIDVEHPALAGCVADYRYFDHAGRVVARKRPFDDCGHGTHTAGIIAGRGLSDRLGVAPGCRLHVAHVLEHGRVLARVLRGFDWLLGNGIRVLAMPLGVRADTPLFRPLLEACVERGVLAIAPIGNLGPDNYHLPAGEPGVLSVGAIDDRGRVPRFSGSRLHEGRRRPELLAPGVDIESAEPGGGIVRYSGTSMAAAFVAGVAALLFEACPKASAAQVELALTSTATPLSKGRRHRCGSGVVDPVAALACLRAMPDAPVESPSFVEPVAKLDPRLARQMRWTPGERVPAIAVFHERRRARRVLAELGRTSAPAARILALEHAGVVFFEALPELLDALVQLPELRYLSAQDVDLG